MIRASRRLASLTAVAIAAVTVGAGADPTEAPPEPDTSVSPGEAERGDRAAPPDPAEELERRVNEAAEAFGARRFEDALSGYTSALALAVDAERPVLQANVAACLYELGRFAEAERRFLLASQSPKLAAGALVDAGFAALAAGSVDRARAHLRSAPAGDAETEMLRGELAASIDRKVRALEARAVAELATASRAAYTRGDYREAFDLANRALARGRELGAADRAELAYASGMAAHRLRAFTTARTRFDLARALSPGEADLHYMAAVASRAAGDRDGAELRLRATLAARPSAETRRSAEALLEDLDPLPPSGPGAWMSIGVGWDSNAAQSGAGVESDGAGGSDVSSPFFEVAAFVDWSIPLGRPWRLAPYYSLDAIALTAEGVRELGVQAHGVGVYLHRSFGRSWIARFGAASTYVLSGIDPIEPFTVEVESRARLQWTVSREARTRLEGRYRATDGLGDFEYLGGRRVEARAEHQRVFEPLTVALALRYRDQTLGARRSDVPTSVVDTVAEYDVPLSYRAPHGRLTLGLELGEPALIEAYGGFERRDYVDDAVIRLDDGSVLPGSEKRRRDDRFETGASVEVDVGGPFSLLLSWELLASRSNVAFDASDPDHALDYDDRTFDQHIVTVAADAAF